MHAFLGDLKTKNSQSPSLIQSSSHSSDRISDEEVQLRIKIGKPIDPKQLLGLDSHAHGIMVQKLIADRVSVIREVAQAMFLTLADVLNSPIKRDNGEFQKLTEEWMSLENAAHDTYQKLAHATALLDRTHYEIPPELAEELMSLEEIAHLILQEIHKIMQLEERAVEEFSRLDDEGIPLKESAHEVLKTFVHQAVTHDPDKLDDNSGYDLEIWTDVDERITLVETDPEMLNDEESLAEDIGMSEQTNSLDYNDPKMLDSFKKAHLDSSAVAHQIPTFVEDGAKLLDDKEVSLEESIHAALQRLADKLAGRGREYRKLVDSIKALDRTDPESFLNIFGVIIALQLGIEFQKICILEEKSSRLMMHSEGDEAFEGPIYTVAVAELFEGIGIECQSGSSAGKNLSTLMRADKMSRSDFTKNDLQMFRISSTDDIIMHRMYEFFREVNINILHFFTITGSDTQSFLNAFELVTGLMKQGLLIGTETINTGITYATGYNDPQVTYLTEPTGIQQYLFPFVGTQRSTASIAMLTQSSQHPVDGMVESKRNSHNSQCHTHTPDSVKQLVERLSKVKCSSDTILWEHDKKQAVSAGNSLRNHFLTVLVQEPNDTRKSDEQTPSWPISDGLSSDNTAERDVKEFQPTENSNFYRGKELTHVMAAKVQNQVHHPVQAANNEGCSFSSQEDITTKNEDIQVCTLHEIAAETTNNTLNEAPKQCEQQELSHPSYVAEYKASPSCTPSVVEVGMTNSTVQLCKEVSTNSTNYLSPVGRTPQTCKNVVQVPFHVLSVDETSTLSIIKTNPCLQSSVEKHSTSPLCPLSAELVADGSPNSLLVEDKASAACPLSSAGKQASSSPTLLSAAEKDSSAPCLHVQENRAVVNNSLKELPASGQEAISLACKLSVEKEVHDRVIPQPSVQRNKVDSSLSLSTVEKVAPLSCEETACPHDLLSVKEEVSSGPPSPSADEQNADTHYPLPIDESGHLQTVEANVASQSQPLLIKRDVVDVSTKEAAANSADGAAEDLADSLSVEENSAGLDEQKANASPPASNYQTHPLSINNETDNLPLEEVTDMPDTPSSEEVSDPPDLLSVEEAEESISEPSTERNEADLSSPSAVDNVADPPDLLSVEICPHDVLSVKEEVSSRPPSPSANEHQALPLGKLSVKNKVRYQSIPEPSVERNKLDSFLSLENVADPPDLLSLEEVDEQSIPEPSPERNNTDLSSPSAVDNVADEQNACPHNLLSVKEEVSSRPPPPSADEQNANTHYPLPLDKSGHQQTVEANAISQSQPLLTKKDVADVSIEKAAANPADLLSVNEEVTVTNLLLSMEDLSDSLANSPDLDEEKVEASSPATDCQTYPVHINSKAGNSPLKEATDPSDEPSSEEVSHPSDAPSSEKATCLSDVPPSEEVIYLSDVPSSEEVSDPSDAASSEEVSDPSAVPSSEKLADPPDQLSVEEAASPPQPLLDFIDSPPTSGKVANGLNEEANLPSCKKKIVNPLVAQDCTTPIQLFKSEIHVYEHFHCCNTQNKVTTQFKCKPANCIVLSKTACIKCWDRTLTIYALGSLFIISLDEHGMLALSQSMIEQFHRFIALNYSLIVHVISKLCFKLDLRDRILSNTYNFISCIQQLKKQDSVAVQIFSVKRHVRKKVKIIRRTPPFKHVYQLEQYPKLSNGMKCAKSVVVHSKDTGECCIDGTKNCVPLKRRSSISKQTRQRAAKRRQPYYSEANSDTCIKLNLESDSSESRLEEILSPIVEKPAIFFVTSEVSFQALCKLPSISFSCHLPVLTPVLRDSGTLKNTDFLTLSEVIRLLDFHTSTVACIQQATVSTEPVATELIKQPALVNNRKLCSNSHSSIPRHNEPKIALVRGKKAKRVKKLTVGTETSSDYSNSEIVHGSFLGHVFLIVKSLQTPTSEYTGSPLHDKKRRSSQSSEASFGHLGSSQLGSSSYDSSQSNNPHVRAESTAGHRANAKASVTYEDKKHSSSDGATATSPVVKSKGSRHSLYQQNDYRQPINLEVRPDGGSHQQGTVRRHSDQRVPISPAYRQGGYTTEEMRTETRSESREVYGRVPRHTLPEWISAVTQLLHVPDYSKMIQRLNTVTPTPEYFVAHRFIRGIAYFKVGKLPQAMRDLTEGEKKC